MLKVLSYSSSVRAQVPRQFLVAEPTPQARRHAAFRYLINGQ